eukprot:g16324.t1
MALFAPVMRPDLKISPEQTKQWMKEIAQTLQSIERWLNENPWLCGPAPTVADLSCYCEVGQLEACEQLQGFEAESRAAPAAGGGVMHDARSSSSSRSMTPLATPSSTPLQGPSEPHVGAVTTPERSFDHNLDEQFARLGSEEGSIFGRLTWHRNLSVREPRGTFQTAFYRRSPVVGSCSGLVRLCVQWHWHGST